MRCRMPDPGRKGMIFSSFFAVIFLDLLKLISPLDHQMIIAENNSNRILHLALKEYCLADKYLFRNSLQIKSSLLLPLKFVIKK